MLLPQNRYFLQWERDQNYVVEVVPSLAETFTRQLCCKDSDLIASEEIISALKILVEALDGNKVRKRADVWADPKKLVRVQMLLNHILHFLSMYDKDELLFEKCRNIPMLQWGPTWHTNLNQVDVDSFLASEYDVLPVIIWQSGIPHRNAGLGLFAAGGFMSNTFQTFMDWAVLTQKRSDRQAWDGANCMDRSQPILSCQVCK